jgi:hypothetical protein
MNWSGTVFIAWKDTQAAINFLCACGAGGYTEADYAYVIKCRDCGQCWEMPEVFALRAVDESDRFEPVLVDDEPVE